MGPTDRLDDDRLDDARFLDRADRRHEPSAYASASAGGMVSCAHYRATAVGASVLSRGGNAVDAAVATSLALAVVESAGSGLGGMAYMLVHSAAAGRTVVLPGPCRAPRLATPERVAASPRYSGYCAVAVPTYVSVLEAALERYGTWSAAAVLEPAIALAEEGFAITPAQHALMSSYLGGLGRSTAAELFLSPEGHPPAAGERFRQPVLASTLRRLAQHGFRDFYEGRVAAEIAADMADNGGFIDAEDLAAVSPAAEEAPLQGRFQGRTVSTAGSPAGGKTLLEMLNLFDLLGGEDFDPDAPGGAELLATIIRRARKDRTRYRLERASDPDYGRRAYAEQIAAEVRAELASGETSHLSVMDAEGNAVALTQSIERSFGAKVATPSLGFLHNGYMKGFKIEAKRHPHYLRPGAVARSNAAPTILFDGDRAAVTIGSTGSERMLSGIFQTLVRLSRQTPFEAVHAPRLHATPDGALLAEVARMRPETLAHLEARGFRLDPQEAYAFKFGGLHMVVADGDRFEGVAEPRRDGAALGPAPQDAR